MDKHVNRGRIHHDLLQYAIEIESITKTAIDYLDQSQIVNSIKSKEDIRDIFQPLAAQCVGHLDRLIKTIKDELTPRSINYPQFLMLSEEREKLVNTFDKFELIAPERAFASVVRVEAIVEEILSNQGSLPREPVKSILRSASSLKTLCSAYELSKVSTLVSALIPQILESSPLHNGEPSEVRDRNGFNLKAAILAVSSSMRPSIESAGIKLDVKTSGCDRTVESNKDKFQNALKLLLQNAAKYTGKLPEKTGYSDTWIKVVGRYNGLNFTVEVDTWGTPVTHEELRKRLIFKRGYRGSFAIRDGIQGSGNGLAEVEEFARASGGRIDVTTRPTDKSVEFPDPKHFIFSLTLPAQQGDSDEQKFADFREESSYC